MLASILPLLLFVMVATFSPGGATTLATASGANFGWVRSLPLLSGISFGMMLMATAAAGGLGSLILAAPSLQWVMKTVGTVYLLWLAWQIAKRGKPGSAAVNEKPASFLTGIWMLLQNPKGWAMTLSAAASFSSLTQGPGTLALLLSLVFGASCMCSLALWCGAGSALSRQLKTERQWRVLNRLLGALLVGSIVPIWL